MPFVRVLISIYNYKSIISYIIYLFSLKKTFYFRVDYNNAHIMGHYI